MIRVALAGDTMLGRLCADTAAGGAAAAAFSEEIREVAAGADLFVANLECCISARGQRWPAPGKPFFFRAPPAAARLLADLGVDVVSLANNHALDYGPRALLDTLAHLDAAGVATIGAGRTREAARAPLTLEVAGARVTILAVADHPADFAAGLATAGTAYADLSRRVPAWLRANVEQAAQSADLVLVTPHWGPNMTTAPPPHVRGAGRVLADAGAKIVAGHSAHVFHGVGWHGDSCILWDLGDFLDDYAVHPQLRNDLGVLWTVEIEGSRAVAVTALPLRLDRCRTLAAGGADADWVAERLARACAALGTAVARPAGERSLRCVPRR